ncbi:hypothetical protein ACHAWU_004196 [Discostella pseudostelligera]|uniref:RING-type domain-containing protein n=1 Tax=Discostella pseudostelligera TaxID=259834 RepID=A0ABD3MC87_9STRA
MTATIEFAAAAAPSGTATAISTVRPPPAPVRRDNAAASTSPLPPSISSHYHRGDPLDIPLIDHHLLTQLLFPRLVSAMQLAFPQVYLDWTTASASNNNHYKTLRWKRIAEGILRTCLIVGSCRRIIVRHHQASSQQKEVSVITPAMHNLGMQIRPVSSTSRGNAIDKNHTSGVLNLLQQYAKVGTLILATVILPTIYKELKLYRKRQLEEHDRQLRLDDIRREEHQLFHSLSSSARSPANTGVSDTDNPHHPRDHHHHNSSNSIIQQRAQKRQSHLLTYLIDTTIGMGEVFLPPLQLVNYVMYLWGRSCTPQLGMLLAGWEYCHLDTISVDANHDDDDGGGGIGEESHHHHQNHQRHVNFQYAHRRLVVEEGLRAVSMILPPALPSHLRIGDGTVGGNSATAATVAGNNHRADGAVGAATEGRQHGTGSDSTERAVDDDNTSRRRSGWTIMRKKILSFMGVIDDEDDNNATSATAAPTSSTSEARRYSLTCSMCHMENPSIPYIASCGHCYCYLCLRMAVTDNLSFRCVDCGSMIVSSARPKVEAFIR